MVDAVSDFTFTGSNVQGVARTSTRFIFADNGADQILFYQHDGTQPTPSENFNLVSDISAPFGVWANDSFIYVLDATDDKIYRHTHAGTRSSAGDITLPALTGTKIYTGISGDANRIAVVANSSPLRIEFRTFAGAVQSSEQINLLTGTNGNTSPRGLSITADRAYVVDSTRDKVFTYNRSTRAHVSSEDLVLDTDNANSSGIAATTSSLYVTDSTDRKLYTYNNPSKQPVAVPLNPHEDSLSRTSVILDWDAPADTTNIDGYTVEHKLSTQTWAQATSTNTASTVTQLAVTSLTVGTEYNWRVKSRTSSTSTTHVDSAWTAERTFTTPTITLDQFNTDGLIVDALGVITTASANEWYRTANITPNPGTSTVVEGELGLGGSNTRIERMIHGGSPTKLVVINDRDLPSTLNLESYFGSSTAADPQQANWTLYIQTDSNLISSSTLNISGGNFVQFRFDSAVDPIGPDAAVINGITANQQIIIAIAKAGVLTFDVTAPTFSIPEATAALAAIGTPVTASSTGQGAVTYALEGADAASFTIDSSGQIHVAAGVTFDASTKNAYSIDVRATNGSLTSTLSVSVNIETPTATSVNVEISSSAGSPTNSFSVTPTEDPVDISVASSAGNPSASFSVNTAEDPVTIEIASSAGSPTNSFEVSTVTQSATPVTIEISSSAGNPTNSFSVNTAEDPVNVEISSSAGDPTNSFEATVASLLSLSDFDTNGLIVDCAAVITSESGTEWYRDSDTLSTSTQSPEEGELGLGANNTLISRIFHPSDNHTFILVADKNRPQSLAMDEYFETSAANTSVAANQTMYILVDVNGTVRTASSNVLHQSRGPDAVRFQFTNTDRVNVFNQIEANTRFIAAIAKQGVLTFDVASPTFSIPENAAALADVGTPVTASSTGQGAVTYALEGSDAASFTIDSNGQIKVAAGITFDRSAKSAYAFTVRARNGSLTATLSVAVNIALPTTTPVNVEISSSAGNPTNSFEATVADVTSVNVEISSSAGSPTNSFSAIPTEDPVDISVASSAGSPTNSFEVSTVTQTATPVTIEISSSAGNPTNSFEATVADVTSVNVEISSSAGNPSASFSVNTIEDPVNISIASSAGNPTNSFEATATNIAPVNIEIASSAGSPTNSFEVSTVTQASTPVNISIASSAGNPTNSFEVIPVIRTVAVIANIGIKLAGNPTNSFGVETDTLGAAFVDIDIIKSAGNPTNSFEVNVIDPDRYVVNTIKSNSGDENVLGSGANSLVEGLSVERVEVQQDLSRVSVYRDGSVINASSFQAWAEGEGKYLSFYFICGNDGTAEYPVDSASALTADYIQWDKAKECMYLKPGGEMTMKIATSGGLGAQMASRPLVEGSNPITPNDPIT